MTHQMPLKTIREKVTLEWPEGHTFKLSYETIQVYDLKLTNKNANFLAMEATTIVAGCLIRPRRLLVRGGSHTYLTLAFMPGIHFEVKDLQSTDKVLNLRTALLRSKVDLDSFFYTSPENAFTQILLDFFFQPFDSETLKEDKKTVLERAFQNAGNGLYASRLHFHCTSPGYVSAYIFLYCTVPSGSPSAAWLLLPKTPFWYSLANSWEPGLFPFADKPADQFACGVLSPGESHLTYIDLKAYGKRCFEKEAFDETDLQFILSSNPIANEPDEQPKVRTEISLFSDSVPVKAKQMATKETRTFNFTGPNNQLQPAKITITNKSRKRLVYRLQAQEPSLFTFARSFGKLLIILPNESATLTVVLNPGAKLSGNQLFRLDTFLLDKEAKTEADYWKAMMRSMAARQMVTTFIPGISSDMPKPTPNWSGGMGDPHAEFKIRPTGQISGLSELGFPLPIFSGAMMNQRPALNVPVSTDFAAYLAAQTGQQFTSPRHSPTPPSFDLLSGHANTPHTGMMAPLPEIATPPGGQPASSSPAKVLDPKSRLNRWIRKTPESPPNAEAPEATGNKPSTGSTVQSPSGAANTEASPETPLSKPPIAPMAPLAPFNPPAHFSQSLFQDQVTGLPSPLPCTQASTSPIEQTTESPLLLTLHLAASPSSPETAEAASKPSTGTAAKQMAIAHNKSPTGSTTMPQSTGSTPVANSSVLRNRNKEKKKDKKRVSPKGPSTHQKAASQGPAKPRRDVSPHVSPRKSPRRASPRRLPSRAPFAPVGDPRAQDMAALFQMIVSLAFYLLLLNALITALE